MNNTQEHPFYPVSTSRTTISILRLIIFGRYHSIYYLNYPNPLDHFQYTIKTKEQSAAPPITLNQNNMISPGYGSKLFAIVFLFTASNCLAQKDKVQAQNIDLPKITRVTIPVKTARFQSNEVKNARADYLVMAKPGQISKLAISSLKKKGHSNSAILATIRQIKLQTPSYNTVSNTDIAEDAQLMLKALPTLSAAEMISAIRDLYDVSTIRLFDIALLTSHDSTQIVNEVKYFNFRCDCLIRNPSDVTSYYPYRTEKSDQVRITTIIKKLYPWECFDYWNTGFRTVILPETNLNEFLRLMRVSQYPLYGGMTSADLADPAINFSVIMGTTAEAMAELMECATLAYLSPGSNACDMEIPYPNSSYYDNEYRYMGQCKHASLIKTRFYLKNVLNVLKRNGISITTMATAAKTRFGTADDDIKQRILSSFDPADFSASEILQASNVLNSN